MTKHKDSKAEQIRTLLRNNPRMTVARIAEICEVKPARVHTVKHLMKKSALKKIRTLSARKVVRSTLFPMPAVSTSPIITMIEPKSDPVNHPAHYKVGGIETIDFIKAKLTPEEYRGYLLGNVLKYASRSGHKGNSAQDTGKMAWYATRLSELEK